MAFWFILLLLIVLVAVTPTWPYSRRWGYYPAGGVFLAMIVIWLMIWFGMLAFTWPWAYNIAAL